MVGWQRLLARLAAWLLRALGATWRLSLEGCDGERFARELGHAGSPIRLCAFWHRNLTMAAHLFRDRELGVFVSPSPDGDLIAAALFHLGYAESPRGSSSRGATAALRGSMRQLGAGVSSAVVTDGPRGPARISKPGVVALARWSGFPITPLAFSAHPCIRFRSWDGTLLPLPFARVVFHPGAPIAVPRDADREQREHARRELDAALNRMTDELDARLGLAHHP